MAITGCQLRNVTADGLIPGLRQAGNVLDLDYPLFFIDRVEDAVPPGRFDESRRGCRRRAVRS
jgi:hypothetical protein